MFLSVSINDTIPKLMSDSGKMAKNGIIVHVLYAQYFNDQTDGCEDENWQVISLTPTSSLPLTKERRTIFNNLVVSTVRTINSWFSRSPLSLMSTSRTHSIYS